MFKPIIITSLKMKKRGQVKWLEINLGEEAQSIEKFESLKVIYNKCDRTAHRLGIVGG